jgi:hypothetical protein
MRCELDIVGRGAGGGMCDRECDAMIVRFVWWRRGFASLSSVWLTDGRFSRYPDDWQVGESAPVSDGD